MPTPQTFTYKTVGSTHIKLDVYVPPAPSINVPILLWFHGGGLLQGYRSKYGPHTVSSVAKYGHVLVSPDYRLAPQASMAEILEDALDSSRWVRDELPRHLATSSPTTTTTTTTTVDTSRIAVSGSSAGGYLALLVGLYSEDVRPKAVLPIYPITNPLGDFFTTPQPVPEGHHLDESLIGPFLARNAAQVSENEPSSPRQMLYLYMLKEANYASLLSLKPGDDTYVVAKQLRKRGSFPPTFIVHGDADRFVGVEQSDEVVQVLKEIGAEVEYERLPGIDHLFDRTEDVELDSFYAFLYRHV